MNVVIALVCVLLVLGAVVTKQRNLIKVNSITPSDKKVVQEVLSEEDEKEDDVKDEEEIIKVSLTPIPTKIPTLKPTVSVNSSFNISDFIYPNSQAIDQKDGEVKLKSGDGSDKITNWYKEKIKSLGMSVNTFVVTKANDKVLNKLVGAGSNREVRITIEKGEGASEVIITISY